MAKAPKVLLLNGTHPNMLGSRQPDDHRRDTLGGIDRCCRNGQAVEWNAGDDRSRSLGLPNGWRWAVLAAGFLLTAALPLIRALLSNIHRRTAFRNGADVAKVAGALLTSA